MSTETPESLQRIWASLTRARAGARRALSSSDAPLAAALVLALAAILQVVWSAEDVGSAMIANLFATLPVALVRRRLPWAAGAVVFGVVVALSGDAAMLSAAAVVALLAVAYLLAGRYGRAWSTLLALPFRVNVITPYSGSESRLPSVLLLVAVVAALALGDAGRQRGRAVAERDEAQRDQ